MVVEKQVLAGEGLATAVPLVAEGWSVGGAVIVPVAAVPCPYLLWVVCGYVYTKVEK